MSVVGQLEALAQGLNLEKRAHDANTIKNGIKEIESLSTEGFRQRVKRMDAQLTFLQFRQEHSDLSLQYENEIDAAYHSGFSRGRSWIVLTTVIAFVTGIILTWAWTI